MPKFQPIKKINDNEKVVISIRLNLSKVEELDKLANKTDISRNQLINQCIEYALNNIDFKKDDTKKSD
jgi:predicted transcriptional regulator